MSSNDDYIFGSLDYWTSVNIEITPLERGIILRSHVDISTGTQYAKVIILNRCILYLIARRI